MISYDILLMGFIFLLFSVQRKRLNKPIPRLVYWYGTEIEEAFSFIPANKIVSYKNGCKRGLNKIPVNIKKKLDGNKKLNGTEKIIVNGLSDMEADAKLPPEERALWLLQSDDDRSDGVSSTSDITNEIINLDEEFKPVSTKRETQVIPSSDCVEPPSKRAKKETHDRERRVKKKPEVSEVSGAGNVIVEEEAPSFDFRVCLQPKHDLDKKGEKVSSKTKAFDLTVYKEDEVMMEQEIRMTKVDGGKFEKKIQYQNIHLNLTFNLEI